MSDQQNQGMGCFAKGCLTLVVVGIAMAAISGGSLYYYFGKFVDNLTAPQSVAIRVEQPTDAQFTNATAQLKRLSEAYQSGQETTVELTAADLNALIARRPDFAQMRGKSFITIADGNFGAEVSLPLDKIPLSRLKGRFFNGKFVTFFEWNNDEVTFKPKVVEANGKAMPEWALSQLATADSQRQINEELKKSTNREFRSQLERFKSIRITGDRVILVTKAGAPKK